MKIYISETILGMGCGRTMHSKPLLVQGKKAFILARFLTEMVENNSKLRILVLREWYFVLLVSLLFKI